MTTSEAPKATVKVRTGIHAGARSLNHSELMFVRVRRTGR